MRRAHRLCIFAAVVVLALSLLSAPLRVCAHQHHAGHHEKHLEHRLEQRKSEVQHLKKSLHARDDKIDHLKDEVESRDKKVHDLKKSVSHASHEESELNSTVHRLERHLKEARKSKRREEHKIDEEKKDLSKERKKVDHRRDDVKHEEHRLSHESSELESARKELKRLNSSLHDREASVEAREQQLDEIDRQREDYYYKKYAKPYEHYWRPPSPQPEASSSDESSQHHQHHHTRHHERHGTKSHEHEQQVESDRPEYEKYYARYLPREANLSTSTTAEVEADGAATEPIAQPTAATTPAISESAIDLSQAASAYTDPSEFSPDPEIAAASELSSEMQRPYEVYYDRYIPKAAGTVSAIDSEEIPPSGPRTRYGRLAGKPHREYPRHEHRQPEWADENLSPEERSLPETQDARKRTHGESMRDFTRPLTLISSHVPSAMLRTPRPAAASITGRRRSPACTVTHTCTDTPTQRQRGGTICDMEGIGSTIVASEGIRPDRMRERIAIVVRTMTQTKLSLRVLLSQAARS